MDLKDEINEMNKRFTMGNIETEAPETEAPGTEAPTTEIPDEVATDSPETEAPSTEAPTTEAPDELAILKAEIEALKADKKPKGPTPTDAPSTEVPPEDQDFLKMLGIEDEEDLTPANINKLMNAVYKKAATDTLKGTTERILRSLPGLISAQAQQAEAAAKIRDKFYSDNKDLVPFGKVVGAVWEELASENPDTSTEDMIKKVAAETRKRLDLHKKATSQTTPPKLPHKKGKSERGNPAKPNLNPLQDEIGAMNKTLRR